MRVSEVSWSNYRRLPDGHIDVRRHLVLVGPNDSGKSSVLRAIHLCLGLPGSQLNGAVEPRDFTSVDAPLILRVVLVDFDDDDRAAFPDEISTVDGESLTVEVVGDIDGDAEQKQVRRRFPYSGHNRSASRIQMARFQWAYVSASRSLYRELGAGATSVVRTLLSTVDLTADEAAFQAASGAFRDALDGAEGLTAFRADLADALSGSLPRTVDPDDLAFTSEADLLDDPLAGVTLTVRDGEHRAPISEQSDGVRALSVLTLLGMSHHGAQIVGIDEPEIHLHHTAQRTIAALLAGADGQRVLVTHSPAVVREMDPLDIVAMGADRVARQLPPDAPMAEIEAMTRHWAPNLIDPLTARAILLVEGPADRIICDQVAKLVGLDLNRCGVCIFEMDGSGLFQRAFDLFGPPGFDVPLYGLLDEDARTSWSEVLGVQPADLDQLENYAICQPDLEGLYVPTLGATRMLELLLASPTFTQHAIETATGAALADLTVAMLTAYCGNKKRKMRSALAVALGLTTDEAEALGPIAALVRSAAGA